MKSDHTTSTINDVARLAGVSKRTVSRVLNNSSKVNAKTRDKILAIIADLDYTPNSQARGLAARRSYMIGLVYDDPNALFIHAIQRGILSVCTLAGYELVVHPCDHESAGITEKVNRFVSRSKIDGLIILPPLSANKDLTTSLGNKGTPYVLMSAQKLDAPERSVIAEDRAVMHHLADHFVELGHERIAFIAGPQHRLANHERLEGFRAGLAAHSITLSQSDIVQGDFTFESGIECGLRLLRRKNRPTAIFAANDEMALGVMHAAHQLDVHIPQQLSIAGYDGSPLAARSIPPLTTFKRQNEQMASLAVRKLIAYIEGDHQMAAQIETILHPELMIAQSTGKAPKNAKL